MRKLQAVGLLTLGIAIGAGTVTFGARTEAQVRAVQSMEELNQRFVMGDDIATRKGGSLPHIFRFVKDRQTGDCYVIYRVSNSDDHRQLLKTDDNACDGF